MASHFFNAAKRDFANKEIDFDSDAFRAILVMTNSTADTDYDAATVSAITTLDEFDGSGFTWGWGNDGRKTVAVTLSDVAGAPGVGYTKVAIADITWAALGAGTRDALGVVIATLGTSDADSVPVFFHEFAASYTASGNDLTYSPHADGAVKFGFNA